MSREHTVHLESVISRSEEIIFTDLNDDVTMMDARTGKYYALPKVGGRIWTLLAQPMSVAALCDRLLSEYRVDRKRCEEEVCALLADMHTAGIVNRS